MSSAEELLKKLLKTTTIYRQVGYPKEQCTTCYNRSCPGCYIHRIPCLLPEDMPFKYNKTWYDSY